ncbi:DUF6934 family protein [Ohtaekwangia sp.]|uniref:DUF6934 family protein n=1 Tax=Ohtaekwangia sp. TaxID=2066019 RepID=UPI002F9462C9
MALNVRIDFENCYDAEPLSADLRLTKFETERIDNSNVLIGVLIGSQPQPLLPNVYNLAFGPMDGNNEIDDQVKVAHLDHSKMFSTIILSALTFLNANADKYLGIDGTNNARAYLYFRIIQRNYDILTQYFDIYGVKYYVRILRKTNDEDDGYPVDADDITAVPARITKGESVRPEKMYNYFIFRIAGQARE